METPTDQSVATPLEVQSSAEDSLSVELTSVAHTSSSSSMTPQPPPCPLVIKNKLYGCGICMYSTNIASHLQRHMRKHTGEKPYACKECPYRGSDAGLLKRHMRTHTGERPFACSLCSYRCSQACTLKEHMTIHTGKKPFPCAYCSYQCSRIGRLKEHVRKHLTMSSLPENLEATVSSDGQPHGFKCNSCDFTSINRDHYVAHLQSHASQPYVCTYCSFKCSVPSELKEHIVVHTTKKSARAPAKNKMFAIDALKTHIKYDGSQGLHVCEVCTYSNERYLLLERHMRNHLAFKCAQCNQYFDDIDELKQHARTHTIPKPVFFVCTECDFRCRSMAALKSHKTLHQRNDKLKCTLCSFKVRSEEDLQQHIMTHLSDKLYQCTTCSESFGTARELNAHVETHTLVNSFACIDCGLSFDKLSLLSSHKKCHEDLKFFTCDRCNFSCEQKTHMQAHTLIHSEEAKSEFQCTPAFFQSGEGSSRIGNDTLFMTSDSKVESSEEIMNNSNSVVPKDEEL